MPTYSLGTTIKVQSPQASSTTTTGTFFTLAANSYAELQFSIGPSTNCTITIGGVVVITKTSGDTTTTQYFGLRAGPSQAVAVATNSGGATVTVSGVSFVNSP